MSEENIKLTALSHGGGCGCKLAPRVLEKLGIHDPLLDLAKQLEEIALKDDYFVSRTLYPNVDFYSGIIYRALGFPTNMYTVLFALGRPPGWIAHWKEQMEDPNTKIGRPLSEATKAAWANPNDKPMEDYAKK